MFSDNSVSKALDALSPRGMGGGGRYEAMIRFMCTGEEMRRVLRGQLAREGLTAEGFRVLVVLLASPDGGRPLTELAAEVALPKHVLGHTLTRLELSRLVVRQRGTDDRRVICVRLTREGRQLIERARMGCCRTAEELLRDLNEEEVRRLSAVCAKLQSAAGNSP